MKKIQIKTGTYHSTDGSVSIVISENGQSVLLELQDEDADSLYRFMIPKQAEPGEKVYFDFRSATISDKDIV